MKFRVCKEGEHYIIEQKKWYGWRIHLELGVDLRECYYQEKRFKSIEDAETYIDKYLLPKKRSIIKYIEI